MSTAFGHAPECRVTILKVMAMRMLQYEIAKKTYEEIKEKASGNPDAEIDALYQNFIFSTLVYANTLTVWSQMNLDEQQSYQKKKEDEYRDYAVKLHEICFELDVDVSDELLDDEELQSDFACYVQLFISLSYRNHVTA